MTNAVSQANIIAPSPNGSGAVVHSHDDNRLKISQHDFLYSHNNTLSSNTTLTANRNYYSDGMLIVNSGTTLTVPLTTFLKIS